jgi:2-oxoglutarate ferredoxin oxidoreductase subunit gamma
MVQYQPRQDQFTRSALFLTHAIILNQPSMDKFESAVKPGGVLMYDPNGITRTPTRKDIRIFAFSATEEATPG